MSLLKDKITKLSDMLLGFISVVFVIVFFWLVGKFVVFVGALIYKEFAKPKPVCYYQYIDSFGNVNKAGDCKGIHGNIYCGDANDVNLAVSVERICESE